MSIAFVTRAQTLNSSPNFEVLELTPPRGNQRPQRVLTSQVKTIKAMTSTHQDHPFFSCSSHSFTAFPYAGGAAPLCPSVPASPPTGLLSIIIGEGGDATVVAGVNTPLPAPASANLDTDDEPGTSARMPSSVISTCRRKAMNASAWLPPSFAGSICDLMTPSLAATRRATMRFWLAPRRE